MLPIELKRQALSTEAILTPVLPPCLAVPSSGDPHARASALPSRAVLLLTLRPPELTYDQLRSAQLSYPQLRPTTDLRRATPTASCARRFVPLLRLVTLSFPIRILFQLLHTPE